MKAIVIGASSGGPVAAETLIRQLPADFSAVVILVLHLPMYFTGSFVSRLGEQLALPIQLITNDKPLVGGRIYVVPGDYHFFITDPDHKAYLLKQITAKYPSVDMAFTSVAEHYGPDTIGVVLTGMGKDGMVGCKAIKQVDGHVIAQDESTSAVYGMPKEVKEAGLADDILPLQQIAKRLLELTNYHARESK